MFLSIICFSLYAQSDRALIGIAMPETHVLRWVKDGQTLMKEAERLGYRAELQYANANQNTQNQQIQNFIRQGARVIIVGSINDGIAPVLIEAKQNGIIIIAYDRIIFNTTDVDYYITFNNYRTGEMMAQSIINGLNLNTTILPTTKNIALFAGSPRDGNAYFYYDGAMNILNPYIDRGVLRVIGHYPRTSADRLNFEQIAIINWQPRNARTRMEDILRNDASNLILDAILTPNDMITRAIIEVMKTDTRYSYRIPILSGQDAEYDSALLIRNGEQYSTVFKNTNRLAEAAIILADAVIREQTPNIPSAILASSDNLREIGNNGKKYITTYLLEPELITRNNLYIPIEAGFYEGWGNVNRLRW